MTLAPCRFRRGRVQSHVFNRSSLQRGNVYSAEDSHVRHMVDTLLSSAAPPPLRHLDQTGHHLAPAGDADRPCQKQVRTCRRKCVPSPTTDHPAATGETCCLYQNGPDAPASSGEDRSELETSPVHHPARNAASVASPRISTVLEIHIESGCGQTEDSR